MKNLIGCILLVLISCQGKQEPKNIKDTTNESSFKQDNKTINNTDGLFILKEIISENFVRIIPPKNADFEFPDSSAKTEPFKNGDFNADGKIDILVYLGACGTGGCMYGLFLNQYDDFYKLVFMDYLKNAEFKVEKSGVWTIESSEELEPYNPSKIQITTFKFDKSKYEYIIDTTFVHHDKEAEEMINE
ncbi:hypothetical protein [Aquimarina litoralis]|uniref:hypothetical protein n=1 Tax=Aquimarina litoralis TaxID=584605 RepID=UPI001C576313|nr:hypothetical protein [Aquimarina litoralis]MBW1297908.1 hypothetical protein [Aquimarina litoralis]